jgi:hypothetical protein
MSVVYAMSPDFVSSLNHAIKELDVVLAPIGFTPVRVFDSVRLDRISVGNQEKCGGKTVLVEDRDGLFDLTQSSKVRETSAGLSIVSPRLYSTWLRCDHSFRFPLRLASPWVRFLRLGVEGKGFVANTALVLLRDNADSRPATRLHRLLFNPLPPQPRHRISNNTSSRP